jgi:hypothetical protein
VHRYRLGIGGRHRAAEIRPFDSAAADGADALIRSRATVSAFAEDRLDVERTSGPLAAAPQNLCQRVADDVAWLVHASSSHVRAVAAFAFDAVASHPAAIWLGS